MKNKLKEVSNARLMTYTKWSILGVMAYYIAFLTEQIVGAMKAGMFKLDSGVLSGYFDVNMTRWGIEWSERARILIFLVLFAAIGIWALSIIKKNGIASKKSSPLFILLTVISALEIFFGFAIRLRWQAMDPRVKAPIMLYYLLPVLLLGLVIVCFIRVLAVQGGAQPKMRTRKKDVKGFGGFLIFCMLRTLVISLSLLFEVLLVAFLCIPLSARMTTTPRFIMKMLVEGYIGQCDGRMLFIILIGAIAGLTAFIQMFNKKASFKANVITMEIVQIFFVLGIMTNVFGKYMALRIDWINFVYIAISILFIVYYSRSDRVANTYIRTKNTAGEAMDEWDEPVPAIENEVPAEPIKEPNALPAEDINEDEVYQALFDACTVNNPAAAREIIESNKGWININKKINHGQTALWNSVFSDDRDELINLLLENGADPNIPENTGTTPFTISFSSRHGGLDSIVKMMLNHGADVNAQDNDGLTALMHYVSRGKEDMVQLLLSKGADKHITSNNGWDALSLAERESNQKMIKLLK